MVSEAARLVWAAIAAFKASVSALIWPWVRVGHVVSRLCAAPIDPVIWVVAFTPPVIAVVRAVVTAAVSPSWTEPPFETVCEPVPEPAAALFDPVPWVLLVLLAFLLADPVPVPDPLAALCEPVPLVLFVLVAFLLAEFVPLAEPLPLLLEPVPDFEPPFFDFEPVFEFMSWPA